MLKIPKLPEKEELEFKEKELLLSLFEQFQSSSKLLLIFLFLLILAAWPGKFFLEQVLAQKFIAAYRPPYVNKNPYNPQDIQIFKSEALPVVPGTLSLYAQIYNPNFDLSSLKFDYHFELRTPRGQVIKNVPSTSYLLAGESKFLLIPTTAVEGGLGPISATLVLDNVRWTKRAPEVDLGLEIIQKNTGINPEERFFVEGLLRNQGEFQVKKAELAVVVYDKTNRNIIAVNSTVLNNLQVRESRYFRVFWPLKGFASMGEIQVIPYVNLLDPGFILEEGKPVPAR